MSRLRVNFLSNIFGSIFQSIIGIIFIPIYIKIIGIESWGLIGIFTLLLAIFSLLDMGISPTMTRELAKYSSQNKNDDSIRDLIRSIEIPYWILSIIIFISVYSLSGVIMKHWIKGSLLDLKTIKSSLILIGIVIGLQLPIGFYSAVMTGLQKQLNLNLINSGASIFRWGGAAIILLFISPTIEAYFFWQIISSMLNIFLLNFFLRKSFKNKFYTPKFQIEQLKDVLRFSVGIMGITILAIILTQTDKFIIIKMLSLQEFSYYSLASVISLSLLKITGPIINSITPKMVHYIEIGDNDQLSNLYHKSSEFLAVLVIPICLVIIFFSKEILLIWTKDTEIVKNTYLIVSVLTLGTTFYTLMVIPYSAQISHGWTSLSIYKNIIAVIIIIPLDILLINKFKGIGAAIGWVTLNMLYIIFEIYFMHKKILKGQKTKWYVNSVMKPVILSLFLITTGRIFMPHLSSNIFIIVYLLLLLLLSYILIVLFSKNLKMLVYNILNE